MQRRFETLARELWQQWHLDFPDSPLDSEADLAAAWNLLRGGDTAGAGLIVDEMKATDGWPADDPRLLLLQATVACTDGHYETALQQRPVGTVGLEVMNREHLDRLSPRGKLGELDSGVMLLTDRNDRVVPPEHSRRIFEELRAREGASVQRLLITPLLSHVTVATMWRVHDLLRLLDIFGELFQKEKR